MSHHEVKICPRCGTAFECKVGSIHQCQCSKISLESVERERIGQKYEDCLCIECLQQLPAEIALR